MQRGEQGVEDRGTKDCAAEDDEQKIRLGNTENLIVERWGAENYETPIGRKIGEAGITGKITELNMGERNIVGVENEEQK